MDKLTIQSDSLNRLKRDGYIVIQHKELTAIKQKLCTRLARITDIVAASFPEAAVRDQDEPLFAFIDRLQAVETDNKITRSLFEVFASSVQLFGLMDDPFFLNLCCQFGIKEPMVWTVPAVRIDRPGESRFLSPVHQDFGSSFLSPNGLVFWIPLAPLDVRTGTILVVPGSHRDGYRPVGPDPSGNWPHVILNPPPDEAFMPVYLNPDEMLMFGPFLIHKSGANVSGNRVRFTLQLRFNDVQTLPQKTSAFVAKRSPYLDQKYQESLNG